MNLRAMGNPVTMTGIRLPLSIVIPMMLCVATPALADVENVPAGALTLDGRQLLQLASRFEGQGRFDEARQVYEAVVQDGDRDTRNEARFRLAQIVGRAGNYRDAAVLLRRVLDERPDAEQARLGLAELLVAIGDETAARREIRALQASDVLPPDVARMVDRWSLALRARKPFGANISVALAPDSNINRATRSQTIGTVLGDFLINDDGKSKSGLGLALTGQAYSRLALSEKVRLLSSISAGSNRYRDRRFNDLALEISSGPEIALGRLRVTLAAGAGRRWYGGRPFLDSRRLSVTATQPIGRRAQMRLSLGRAHLDHHLNDLEDGHLSSAQADAEYALSARSGLALSVGGDRRVANDAGYSTRGWHASIAGWQELGSLTATAKIDLGSLRADRRLLLFPDRRDDRYRAFSVGATMRRWQWQGFAPSIRLVHERNRSTVGFYDYRRNRAEFGLTRAF